VPSRTTATSRRLPLEISNSRRRFLTHLKAGCVTQHPGGQNWYRRPGSAHGIKVGKQLADEIDAGYAYLPAGVHTYSLTGAGREVLDAANTAIDRATEGYGRIMAEV
jgi:hypothetical protein